MSDVLVEMRGVNKEFRVRGRRVLRAVVDVDLDVRAGEILGVVGESGSGKTTLGRCLLGLTKPTSGTISIGGQEFAPDDPALRRAVQPVFQDSFGSLDPRWTVRRSIREALDTQRIGDSDERDARVTALMAEVGLGVELGERRPGTLSGGQRQRVGIAAALAPRPNLLVADEPVSALDVSVQAQILNLLAILRREQGVTIVFITHDLSVVEHLADRVAVMYLGRIIEVGRTADVFAAPAHPYTQALLAAAPHPDPAHRLPPKLLMGETPSPINPPTGCAFHPRCPIAIDRCTTERPVSREISPGRLAACHLAARSEPIPEFTNT
jgi:oligopeptide transport system ATP-binding protein